MRYRVSYHLWTIGWLQWGKSINAITKEAEKELEEFRQQNPTVDVERLKQEVKSGYLRPV